MADSAGTPGPVAAQAVADARSPASWSSLSALVLLIAFVLANSHQVEVGFVVTTTRLSLIWVLLIAAVLGALVDRLVILLRQRRKKAPQGPPDPDRAGPGRRNGPRVEGWGHAPGHPRRARGFGKSARALVPRSLHGEWQPRPGRTDPLEILALQATTRLPELVPIRYGRMAVSPFTFFRGAAAVMASDLATEERHRARGAAVR